MSSETASQEAIQLRKTVARCARAVVGASDEQRAIQELDDANTAIDAYNAALHARIAELTKERDEAISSETHAAWREVKAQRDDLTAEVERLQIENSELRLARGGKLISARPIAAGPAYERIAELEAEVRLLCSAAGLSAPHEGPEDRAREVAERALLIAENRRFLAERLDSALARAAALEASNSETYALLVDALARAAAAERDQEATGESLRMVNQLLSEIRGKHGGTTWRLAHEAIVIVNSLLALDAARRATTGEHADHGRGSDSGPDDPDCSCRTTEKASACAANGCGFCSTTGDVK